MIREARQNLAMRSCRQIVTSLSFFQLMANFQLSQSRIPGAWPIRLMFPLTIKVLFLLKKMLIFAKKKYRNQQNERSLGTKRYTFLKLHMCLHLRTKFQVSNSILASFRQGWGVGVILPPPPQNEPLKIPL